MPPQPEYITTCLCPDQQGKICGHQFKGSPVPHILNSAAPPPELLRKAQAMTQHLASRHPQTVMSVTFLNTLILFDSQDPEIARWKEEARRQLHLSTLRHRIDDQSISDAIAVLGLPDDKALTVTQFVQQIRDAYEESGQFAQKQEQPAIVTR